MSDSTRLAIEVAELAIAAAERAGASPIYLGRLRAQLDRIKSGARL